MYIYYYLFKCGWKKFRTKYRGGNNFLNNKFVPNCSKVFIGQIKLAVAILTWASRGSHSRSPLAAFILAGYPRATPRHTLTCSSY